MKKITFLALLIGLSMQSVSLSAAEKLDGIIAVIGDEVVLRSELDAYTLMRLKGLNIQPDSTNLSQYKKIF